jgi:deoxyribodipyrimidine photo-lyase
MASDKRETAAFTLRPKIRLLLPSFLKPIPRFSPMPGRVVRNRIDVEAVLERLKPDPSVAAVPDFEPGTAAGMRRLRTFVSERLEDYPENHNDPVIKGTSDLSPWLHFGQVSAQTAALNVSRSGASAESKESFLEQLIVRRELADNFCLHAPDYDSFSAFPAWARKTLDNHRTLKRPARYTPRQFEHAETHEPLWNACQTEMVRSGKMHNYMRMYWAKKILEWSDSPESALRTAIRLNDRYSLDGRDPNGYTGIAWAIGGVHDRPWPERPVFGMIRYMSAGGAKGKFDTKLYIRRNS